MLQKQLLFILISVFPKRMNITQIFSSSRFIAVLLKVGNVYKIHQTDLSVEALNLMYFIRDDITTEICLSYIYIEPWIIVIVEE